MQEIIENLASLYARWVMRQRWAALAVCLLVTFVAGLGLRNFAFTADYKVYFGKDNAELIAFNELENTYTSSENILFVLHPDDKNVFTRQTLEIVSQLSEKAWQIPHAIRVDSITNYQHSTADGDELTVGKLVPATVSLNDADLAGIRNVALQEPALAGRLISYDAGTTGVAVTLQFPGTDHTDHLPESVDYANRLAAELQSAHPEMTVVVSGLALLSMAEVNVSERDLYTLVPMMLGLMIVLLVVLLRTFTGTLATLAVVGLSVITAMGLMAWLGIKLNASTALTPVIILTLAVADSVHILLTALHEMRAGNSKEDAIVESLRVNAEPVFLTTLTTSIGFLSLNFSDAPPFNDLGNFTAVGVVAAWFFSMTILPVVVSILPLRARVTGNQHPLPMERFGNFVVSRRVPLFWVMMIVSLSTLSFIPRLELDDRFVQWFDESLPFRVATDFATANLTGPYTLEFSIGSDESGGISEPAYLERLDAFTDWLRGQPEVTHVNSFAEVMKRLNRSMHGDDPEQYRLPVSREMAAQYLLLYEMSLPYGLDLNSQIDLDKAATRLTVTLDTVSQQQIIDVIERSEAWLVANAPPAMQARATGTTVMFVYIAIRNIVGMLQGTAIAFVLISLVLIVSLRSIRLGLVSLIPNFIPILITFGLWAIVVGEIGIIASVITATSMGLIVDDTVHILSKYRRAKRERARSTHDAIRYGFSHVGKALLVTTLILVAGFTVLAFSDFKLNVDLGVLTATAVSMALATDFLLLPSILMFIDKDKRCDCVSCRASILSTA
ncbi:MAG: MMPL family transporter [Burkholderiales bacterium]|nr:MMPL family transporter [Burkholderiales bacterium]